MRDRRFVSTVVGPAASYALVDLDTLKTYLGLTGTLIDAVLTLWVNAASAAAAKFCNQPFVVETLQDQFWPAKDGMPWTVRDRPDSLLLKRGPVTNSPSPSLTRPPVAPTLTYAAGGALAARTYYARLTYVTASGETAAGLETRLVIPASNLVAIAAPGPDYYALATSYNVYVGTSSGGETLQASGLGLTTAWTEPSTGLVAGAAMPAYALVVEAHGGPLDVPPSYTSTSGAPTPLAESVDFLIDAGESAVVAEIYRLDHNGNPKGWRGRWISALYTAGFATVPDDVVEVVTEMVKQRYFAQNRDPMARSIDVSGVINTSYWFGQGPGSDTDMPPHIQAKLERYRVPVIG
jgi:hypothetical protein